jgi:tRNA pseudouridine32 synthase/23S rRNA pseudouridine746 synthase
VHSAPLPTSLPLPTRDGVGPSCVGLPAGEWSTDLDFLVARFPAIGRAAWLARIEAGEVIDEHGRPVTPLGRYRPHRRVYYYRSIENEPHVPFEEHILFQDEHLLVADKPHFLPVAPVGKYLQETLLVRLKRRLGIDTLVPAHRIDRGTAGLVLFSVTPATRAPYQRMFAQREVRKTYEAIVRWPGIGPMPAVHRSRLAEDTAFMRTREVPGEANSETHMALAEALPGGRARLRLSPVTGRRHQLRVHCAALGMPIVNDPLYPELLPEGGEDMAKPLQLLARTLRFRDPVTGVERFFETRLRLARAGS